MRWFMWWLVAAAVGGCYSAPVSYKQAMPLSPAETAMMARMTPDQVIAYLQARPFSKLDYSPADFFEQVDRSIDAQFDPATGHPTRVTVHAGHKGDADMVNAVGAQVRGAINDAKGAVVGTLVPVSPPPAGAAAGATNPPATPQPLTNADILGIAAADAWAKSVKPAGGGSQLAIATVPPAPGLQNPVPNAVAIAAMTVRDGLVPGRGITADQFTRLMSGAMSIAEVNGLLGDTIFSSATAVARNKAYAALFGMAP